MRILTFDLEEWFHLLDNESTKTEKEWSKYESRFPGNVDKILDLLQHHNLTATFFCLGWAARTYPQVLKKIDELGFEVASHSNRHQLAYDQNRSSFRHDLEESIKAIEDVIGKKPTAYRAPGFSFKTENKWVFEVLIECGFKIDCSIFPAKRAHGGFEQFGLAEPGFIEVNGLRIKEFPINLYSFWGKNIIFSGGGYFRLLPYWLIRRLMAKSDYVMTYFHPRDFDPDQPLIKDLPLIRKFKSYYGLKGALAKLNKMLEDFHFVDLQEADRLYDWEKAKVIRL